MTRMSVHHCCIGMAREEIWTTELNPEHGIAQVIPTELTWSLMTTHGEKPCRSNEMAASPLKTTGFVIQHMLRICEMLSWLVE
jgi:hypothetical protein